MKNFKIVPENIMKLKKQISAVIATGIMLTAGNITASAEQNKITAQDVVDAMITGTRISAELTETELDQLMLEAEQAIEDAGASLLPEELTQRYNSLNNLEGDERVQQLAIIAMECDTMLYDGTSKIMTYPEAIQFSNVTSEVCDELQNLGKTKIYSVELSKMTGEDTYIQLEDVEKQAKQVRRSKTVTYVTAIGTDLGFYDDCYDINPPTGSKDQTAEKTIAVFSGAAAVALMGLKKKEQKETTSKTR